MATDANHDVLDQFCVYIE